MLELNSNKGAQQMSNIQNDRILDEIRELGDVVQFHREHWESTLWDHILEEAYLEAIKTLDARRINQLLKESSAEMFTEEYQPNIADHNQYNKRLGFNLGEFPF